MNSKTSYQKRLILPDTNERGLDVSRCIICQRTAISTENGRRKIIKQRARLFRYS